LYAVGLHNPKTAVNVGHVLRAADAYGASMVAITGNRVHGATNVSRAEKRIPVLRGDDLHDLIPYGCVPVAVDLVEGAEDLRTFVHPKNAFYVFGGEDETLGQKVLSWCKYKVYVPTNICMNLSACVNVVLYDRMAKMGAASSQRKFSVGDKVVPIGKSVCCSLESSAAWKAANSSGKNYLVIERLDHRSLLTGDSVIVCDGDFFLEEDLVLCWAKSPTKKFILFH